MAGHTTRIRPPVQIDRTYTSTEEAAAGRVSVRPPVGREISCRNVHLSHLAPAGALYAFCEELNHSAEARSCRDGTSEPGNCDTGDMAISAKLLGEDEYVVVSTRTHWKALIFPVFVLLVVAGAGGFLAAIVPAGSLQTLARIAILAVGVVVLATFAAKPFLNWFFSTYTLTNRRLITRHGILTRTGRDIPLMRINDVSYEHGLMDRILRCGTLHIESAGERGQVILPDVPHVEHVHLQMSDLLFGGPEGKPGDGILDDEEPRPTCAAAPSPSRTPETLFSSTTSNQCPPLVIYPDRDQGMVRDEQGDRYDGSGSARGRQPSGT